MAGFRYWGPSSASALRLVFSTTRWPYQEPKLEVPTIYIYISKVTFPNLPPAQGHASPSRKLVLLQIDHNYTVGVIYVYICIDCQSSILSHIVPELINNLICWNCKGCIGKSIGPVQYTFTIPSLLAQCHIAGSMPRCWLSTS